MLQAFRYWVPALRKGGINVVFSGSGKMTADMLPAQVNVVSYNLAVCLVSVLKECSFQLVIAVSGWEVWGQLLWVRVRSVHYCSLHCVVCEGRVSLPQELQNCEVQGHPSPCQGSHGLYAAVVPTAPPPAPPLALPLDCQACSAAVGDPGPLPTGRALHAGGGCGYISQHIIC